MTNRGVPPLPPGHRRIAAKMTAISLAKWTAALLVAATTPVGAQRLPDSACDIAPGTVLNADGTACITKEQAETERKVQRRQRDLEPSMKTRYGDLVVGVARGRDVIFSQGLDKEESLFEMADTVGELDGAVFGRGERDAGSKVEPGAGGLVGAVADHRQETEAQANSIESAIAALVTDGDDENDEGMIAEIARLVRMQPADVEQIKADVLGVKVAVEKTDVKIASMTDTSIPLFGACKYPESADPKLKPCRARGGDTLQLGGRHFIADYEGLYTCVFTNGKQGTMKSQPSTAVTSNRVDCPVPKWSIGAFGKGSFPVDVTLEEGGTALAGVGPVSRLCLFWQRPPSL